jgi:molecular chaperone GrpE (heat shock protein)
MNNENKQQELTAIKEELRSLQERVDKFAQHNDEPVATDEAKPAQSEPAQSGPTQSEPTQGGPTEQSELKALTDQMAHLAELIDTAAYQEGIIRDLHEELQRYKKGLLADIAKGYVMDIIRIYEHLADTNAHFAPEAPEFDARHMKQLLSNNLLSISDLLEDQYSIESFTPQPGSPYLPKEHKAMRTIETDDDSLAATVAECLGSGFRYSLDGKLLRQARVVVYKKKEA